MPPTIKVPGHSSTAAHADHLTKKAWVRSRRSACDGAEAKNLHLQKLVPAKKEGVQLNENASHGLRPMGSAKARRRLRTRTNRNTIAMTIHNRRNRPLPKVCCAKKRRQSFGQCHYRCFWQKRYQRSTHQTRKIERTKATAIQVRPHPHRQIVWRIYEISLRRHSRLACAQPPRAYAEDGGAQKEGRRKVTSGTTQKEGGRPSLQGHVKCELEPVTRRPRRSHSQSNCEGSRAVWPSTGSSRRTGSSRGCQRSVSGNLIEIQREGFKAMLWTVPG